ncbi:MULTISPECIES: M23 family metallopeptidase [unclassified Caulobacter]|uniref:M23 family metallopeptidase n=1 Tax=unclassified Caulobacter TaxID=2648921 RepID=UPI0006FB007B|nr:MULTISPECIES: M23 family metallopeptidase [unclassified Caulobacter]KQV55858.1 peptidase M23 [Caulobacter sp. Root342]KQV70968.1 peptidase M23 [Caulobacter sp. Root343]
MNASTAKIISPAAVRCVLGLAAVFAPMVVAATERPASHRPGPAPIVKLLAEITAKPKARPTTMELVWKGADIDGDGAADFANPTGAAPRGHDDFGDGEFGARRDGGTRAHEGVDYVAKAGQAVSAPMSGYVTKIGYAYAGDTELKFVEITNPALDYAARAFYVTPDVEVGQSVRLGQPIGTVESLQGHYPGITNHVHLEILAPGGDRVNAAQLITPRMVAVAETAASGD